MTSMRIIEPINFLLGAPVYYQTGNLAISDMIGITDEWINYLWNFQKYLKKIENSLTANGLNMLQNITCSDTLAANFYPSSKTSFQAINFTWTSSTNNFNIITPLWRRYYKYLPSETTTPIYLCIEGGLKGGNATSQNSSSRVTAHLSVSISTSFSETIGLLGNITTHFFPTAYDLSSSSPGGVGNFSGNLYFYTNGDDFYLSLMSLQNISKSNDYLILGRTSASYTTPNNFHRGIIFSKSQVFVSGMQPSFEPVCIMPPVFTGFNSTGLTASALNISSLNISTRFITVSSVNYMGVKALVDECVETVKTQGRIIAEPFTFTDLGGNYYVLPKVIRLVDPDRSTLNVYEQNLSLFGEAKKIAVIPLMLTLSTVNSSIYNNIGATTIGMMLDDSIINV
ncbi:hypothetical protein [uncultured Acinetobacter sp.]|uniref:hypothetical protein n=1 Tax=uncultured Acinetobacter sp. TaxID=165433 RepID=UPI0025911DF6|nr:hypothetical protein [uncultured Acinetobacter sp.]